MSEIRINFPAYIERTIGFSLPCDGNFYILSHDYLILYSIDTGTATRMTKSWDIDVARCVICLDGEEIPFIGLWGGKPILVKEGVGQLTLSDGLVTFTDETSHVQQWQMGNFSGDWEQVTFDSKRKALLYGAPYGFDYQYVELQGF